MQIEKLVAMLDAASELTTDVIAKAMAELDFDHAWVEAHIPSPLPTETYGRTLLHSCERYEVVLASWPVGIRTLPHNHGVHDSVGMVRVLAGEIMNEVYEVADLVTGRLESKGVVVLGEGAYAEVSEDLLHRMGNHRSDCYAHSLHVYSPAIVAPNYWDPDSLMPMSETVVVGLSR